jgi:hypothetical protein
MPALTVHGIIFDEAHVLEKTVKLIPENLKERCSVAAGNFLEKF